MERHALAFRIKPGAQDAVRGLLAGYRAPRLDAGNGTRLLGTTVFSKDDLVVRTMDIEGDLSTVAAHLARDPVIQDIERRLLPHLVDAYDPSDIQQRRDFMARRRTELLLHRGSPAEGSGTRHALLYPIKPGRADSAAEILIKAGDPPLQTGRTTLCSTSVFCQGGVIFRVFEIDGRIDELIEGLARAAEVRKVGLGMAEIFAGPYDFTSTDGLLKFFTENLMITVTDRRAET